MRSILILGIITFVIHNQAFAEKLTEINGSHSSKNSSYESLIVSGNFVFNDVRVENKLIVNGNAEGDNLQCNSLKSNGFFEVKDFKAQNIEINGSFVGKNIEVEGNSNFNGVTKIMQGKLNNVQSRTTYISFSKTIIDGNVFVKKINSKLKLSDNFSSQSNKSSKQILKLKKGSLIMGSVKFEDRGEIYLSQDSEIKGEVTNAKIIRKN